MTDARGLIQDLFAAARHADFEAVVGAKLWRSGRRWRGGCPLCGASAGKKADGAFSADPQTHRFVCFACGASGDVIALERALRGGTAREAAERLAPSEALRLERQSTAVRAAPAAVEPKPAAKPAPPDTAAAFAGEIWREAKPAMGTLVERYLWARGVRGRWLDQAVNAVRFHPSVYHSGPWREPVRLPAMIARVGAPNGPTGGVHVTYLRADGGGKADVSPAKRMWGPQARDGISGGAWLTSRPAGGARLVVGEGIESTLSAAQLLDAPAAVVATLSLGHLQGGWLQDAWGRMDPACVAADPDKPAFTWPADPAWREVVIAVDRDMRPIRVRARKLLGGTYDHTLDAEARARICASLAEQAWRRSGVRHVRSIAPAAGRDFNDELRARRVTRE